MAKKFYAVRKGRKEGVYSSWDECKAQIHGFSGAEYKSFLTLEEAAKFMEEAESKVEAEHDHDHDTLIAYVDGSYLHSEKRFSYGMVILENGTEHTFCESFCDEQLASMRNVAGEIKGAEAAMTYALEHGSKKLIIYHDYEGIAKWCNGQWNARLKGTQAYRDFYLLAAKSVQISFCKVAGHTGDYYNEYADRLAKQALGLTDASAFASKKSEGENRDDI